MKYPENFYLLCKLNTMMRQAEYNLAAMIGAKLYKSEIGFTQDQIYTYGGREDSVFALRLKKDSASYLKFGETIVVCFVYTLKERKALEEDVCSLNSDSFAKAKLLVSENKKNIANILLKEGVATSDIVEMTVLPSMADNNTYPSKEKRTPGVLEIPFQAEGGGRDIHWIYNFLKKLKSEGVGLMPEDEAEYLAYKLLLEKEELTEEEKKSIFDAEGRICNNSVAYYYLQWKKTSGLLSEKQQRQLNMLEQNRFYDRLALAYQILKDQGLSIEKFAKNFPKQATFLLKKINSFNDRSFNTTGKYPLFINFQSFLHIYFRHTKELNVSRQYADRDKFQLEEKDIMTVINIVMNALNDEYQAFKEQNPNGRFYRRGEMAYYYNGDYYNVVVNSNGSISTFYKGTGKKNTSK